MRGCSRPSSGTLDEEGWGNRLPNGWCLNAEHNVWVDNPIADGVPGGHVILLWLIFHRYFPVVNGRRKASEKTVCVRICLEICGHTLGSWSDSISLLCDLFNNLAKQLGQYGRSGEMSWYFLPCSEIWHKVTVLLPGIYLNFCNVLLFKEKKLYLVRMKLTAIPYLHRRVGINLLMSHWFTRLTKSGIETVQYMGRHHFTSSNFVSGSGEEPWNQLYKNGGSGGAYCGSFEEHFLYFYGGHRRYFHAVTERFIRIPLWRGGGGRGMLFLEGSVIRFSLKEMSRQGWGSISRFQTGV